MYGSNVVCIWQGLGNQMFQYAFAKSLEIHTKRKVYIDPEFGNKKIIGQEMGSKTFREYGLCNFNISLSEVNELKRHAWDYTREDKWYYEIIKELLEKGKYPYKYYSQKGFSDISVVNPSFEEVENNTYLKGWFQTEDFFSDIRDVLLKEFELKEEISIPDYLIKLIEGPNSVSIHIRRGDYKRGNMVLEKDYYERAKYIMKDIVEDPVWIIFSDDISYVKENFPILKDAYFIDESCKLRDYEQLIMMSRCKNNIIANSTFSWWGAWLNQNRDKCVVAPIKWFSSQKNIVPKDWIRV